MIYDDLNKNKRDTYKVFNISKKQKNKKTR